MSPLFATLSCTVMPLGKQGGSSADWIVQSYQRDTGLLKGLWSPDSENEILVRFLEDCQTTLHYLATRRVANLRKKRNNKNSNLRSIYAEICTIIQMRKLSFHSKAFYNIWKVLTHTNSYSMVYGHLCEVVVLWYNSDIIDHYNSSTLSEDRELFLEHIYCY